MVVPAPGSLSLPRRRRARAASGARSPGRAPCRPPCASRTAPRSRQPRGGNPAAASRTATSTMSAVRARRARTSSPMARRRLASTAFSSTFVSARPSASDIARTPSARRRRLDARSRARAARAARDAARQLAEVHRRARALGQPAELREAACAIVSSRRDSVSSTSIVSASDSGASRRSRAMAKRIGVSGFFELVRHLPRRLAQRRGALRLERAHAAEPQLRRHLAHPVAQHHELRRALARRAVGQRLARADHRRPADQLAQRAAQVPAQVSGHARRHERSAAATPAAPRLPPTTGARRVIRNSICLARSSPSSSARWCSASAASCVARERAPGAPRPPRAPPSPRSAPSPASASTRQRAHHRELPRRRQHDRRDQREGEEDEEETSAKAELPHGHSRAR